ncbi:putative nonribosomal peptide synthetase, partial [Scleroderma citrinum]
LPPFHTMGVYTQVFVPMASLRSVSVYPPTAYLNPTAPPVIANSQNALENAVSTNSNGIISVPSLLEEWVSSPEAVKQLTRFLYVAYAGGPLAKKTGDSLVEAGVNVASLYGSTECGPFLSGIRGPEDAEYWEWMRPSPNSKIRWVPLGDGTYEMQVLTSETHQLSVENLPDVRGYATSDVFIEHPTMEGLYKIVGRLDDVLVLSSGEKTVPGPMESVIGTSPYVSGVCIFGRGRHQVGVLVEPRQGFAVDVKDEIQVAEFRNLIWPVVEEANRDAPSFSRIFKEMILVTSTDKPMLRAGKGTVTKKATISLYEPEINALYESVEASATAGIEVPLPAEWTPAQVKDWLMVHATAVNSDTSVNPEVDLFEQGFDSLSATFLRNRIVGSLKASPIESVRVVASRISPNVVFSNPTLAVLANHLVNLITGKASAIDHKADIERMVEKYSSGLQGDIFRDLAARDGTEGHTILVTGSTGGLGSYMLASLLGRKEVIRIYALNRRSKTTTAAERQRSTFEGRGLDTGLLESDKLVYVEGDTSKEQLGLNQRLYEEIRDAVTVIIHNAWRIDFNLSLATLEPNVRGTRYLIDLALASKRATKPRFMFTSSITSAQGWDRKRGRVPEEVMSDASLAVGGGYGSSKYVSETILVKSGLPATSFRIGQITGAAPRGAWSTTEWVPIVVKSSVTLGALPDIQASMAWLPTDAVSGAILDVALGEDEPPMAINLVHPRPVEWEALMRPISAALFAKNITAEPLPLIPSAEWYHRLETLAVNANEDTMKRVPATKLLNYLRSFAPGVQHSGGTIEEQGDDANVLAFDFATDVAERASKIMRELPPISKSDATRWVDYWESAGFFHDLGTRNLA